MGISAPFAQVLAAGRRPFNARVEEARRRSPGFDTGAFSAFLQEGVDGLIAAVDALAPARTMAVALVAYDVALALCVHGLVGPGARFPLLNTLWARVLPQLAARIADKPNEVLGSLSNAAVHLAGIAGVRGEEWLQHMGALGPGAATVDQLLDLGKLLAWRAGVVHFRAGALGAAQALPEALALAALGAPAETSWPALLARLSADPWAAPQLRRVEGWQVGAFTGFGGSFPQPPELRAAAEGFWVRSGARHHLALADAWGAVLLPATAEEFAAGTLPRPLASPQLHGSRLVFADRELELDLPSDGLSMAADAHTLAIASPCSHVIRLLPLR